MTLGDGTAEVAHEALIRRWPTLRRWLDEDREGLRLHRRLGNAARLWAEGGREDSDLYRGARLATALEWAQGHRDDLNAVEREFLDESRVAGERDAERQRRANRRLRGLLLGAGVLLVAAVVAGIVALVQGNKARDEALTADSQRVGAQALAETSPDRSLLFAVAGVDLEDSLETRSDLLTVLQDSPSLFQLIRPSESDIAAVAASPDGRLMATVDSKGAVQFTDIRTWEPQGEPVQLEGQGSQQAMVFSADGALAVATASGDRANLYLVDPLSGRKRLVRSWHSIASNTGPRRFTRFAFSPDGKRLAVAVSTGAPEIPVPTATRLYLLDMPSGDVAWQRKYPLQSFQNEAQVEFASKTTLVTSAQQGQTLLWDATAGRIERRFDIGGPFAVSPDGRQAAIAANNPDPADPTTALVMLDLRTGEQLELPAAPARTWIISLAFTPDGHKVVTGSTDAAVRVWDAASGAIPQTFTGQLSGRNLAVVPDGRTVVTGGESGSVAAWDLSGEQQLSRAFVWNSPDQTCLTTPCFVIDPRGAVMATSQADGTVALIDIRDRKLAGTLPARTGPRRTRSRSSPTAGTSQWVASTDGSRSGTCRTGRSSAYFGSTTPFTGLP